VGKKTADMTRCALLCIRIKGIKEQLKLYTHKNVRVERATVVATSLPTTKGEPHDVTPRNFFCHRS
jgi:hypothetical protein